MGAGDYDVIILGAGAAGAMCGWQAGLRGKKVLVLDHAARKAEKIRISGGGRCNFTNIYSTPKNFLSDNPHFCISALKRYGPWDFVDLVNQHGIGWHDKGDGELFCDERADKIIDMLFGGLASVGADVVMEQTITNVECRDGRFQVTSEAGRWGSAKLVVATGGLSIPKIGATGFGYDLARQFGHTIVETRAGLVPFRFTGPFQDDLKSLSGVSLDATVQYGDVSFSGPVLFTHRGLSGPAILQISSYWRPGEPVSIDLLPGQDPRALVEAGRTQAGKKQVSVWLGGLLPQRFAAVWCRQNGFEKQLGALGGGELERLAGSLSNWQVRPAGTEGYRTAEVTVGGVNTDELSSKSMESKLRSSLYFIGEVVDVTGHLGGHNFQWAWASAHAVAKAL